MADLLDEMKGAPEAPSVTHRKFDDLPAQRQAIYGHALKGVQARFPIENQTHRIELAGADYGPEYAPTRSDEKQALMSGGRLHRPLKGTLRLVDKASGATLDEKSTILAHVPHLNSRGLFVHNGTTWSIRNQARLRPGVYVRKQQNGGVEAHFNTKPGTGRGFRVNLEPESGVFKMQVEQSSTRLYPLLHAIGVTDEQMQKAWGPELFRQNWREVTGHDMRDVRKVVEKLGRGPEKEVLDHELGATLKSILGRTEVDPETTELTLGQRHKQIDHSVLLNATQKVLKVAKGEAEGDNRDSQAFQSIHSAEDLIGERLQRDQMGAARTLLYKATKSGKLDHLSPGLLTGNIHALFRGSGLAQAVEDINPFETYDSRQAVTRMGEGGITSTQAVSRDARGVQPSYFGLIDPTRAPESSNIGLDMRVTDAALKGSDGQLYVPLQNARHGGVTPVSARQMAKLTVAFPGEMDDKSKKKVRALVGENIRYVNRGKVDYSLPSGNDMFSRAANMIPMAEGVKSGRLLMGARMLTQALPLRDAEAPLVTSVAPDGSSYYEQMGRHAGAVHAEQPGVVSKITPDGIEILHPGGQKTVHDLFNHYPLARKTMLHNTPVVEVGQQVAPGQLLAHSNFTDKKGHAAPGLNMRVGYLSGKGATYEDAIVISESAAKKLSSEHQYKHELELGPEVHSTKTEAYKAVYGDKFKADQYKKLDENGVVQIGAIVNPGDPVVLGIGKRQGRAQGALMSSPKSSHTDLSQTWDHPQPGIVTDVVRTKSGVKVSVKSYEPMTIGSKMANQYGGKGVISQIIPDHQMPHDENAKPLEVLMNPLGIITRVNPAVLASTLLGKIADKRGQPYQMKTFGTKGLADFALAEAQKHGVKETETLTDPSDGRKIPNVFTGHQYMMKLHHTAESKLSARDVGGYAVDESPARGGPEGAKRIGMLDIHSLMSSGATEFLKDAKLIRGQRNEDYWRKLKMGETPTAPTESFANKHFQALLRSAGVNLKEKPGNKLQLSFMTDKDVDALAQHEISHSGTFDFDTMKPHKDGLFDIGKTGGADGTRFTKIQLPSKIPNPLAQEPIVRLLGLTNAKFEQILSGKEDLNGKKGPEAIEHALQGLNMEREIELAKQEVRTESQSRRDAAVKRLGYLTGLQKQGIKPEDLMISKIPVLPPKYRPILRSRGVDMIHDANYLYHDLMEAGKNVKEHSENFGEAGDQTLTLYNAAKAVTGIGDPINERHKEQGVKGMLRYAIGVKDSPKYSRFQRKVLGNSVDTVGRSVITIDPELDMDQVGIPEDMAWQVFRPWVIRRMVREGTPASEAIKAVRDKSPAALRHLSDEMKVRPVVYNRAPSLHRYNYVGGLARINKGRSDISIPQVVTKGLGADFDGDAINVHVPVSDEAVKDVYEKLFPSKNLLHPNSFDVHLEPTQDYLAGLYLASQKDAEKKTRVFVTADDARKAYARGEIGVRDPVQILQS